MRELFFILLTAASVLAAAASPTNILFNESFDDAELVRRNWYDGTRSRRLYRV